MTTSTEMFYLNYLREHSATRPSQLVGIVRCQWAASIHILGQKQVKMAQEEQRISTSNWEGKH